MGESLIRRLRGLRYQPTWLQVTGIALVLLVIGLVAMVDLIFVETYILYQTGRGEAGIEEAISNSALHTAAAVYLDVLAFPAARFAWHMIAINSAIEVEWARRVGELLSLIGVFVNVVMYAFLIGWGWNAVHGAWVRTKAQCFMTPSE